MKDDAERKRKQRARDKKAGLVDYQRERLRPEWVVELDKLLARLKKSPE